ncbi:MAG: amidase [Myxococcota bacterium]
MFKDYPDYDGIGLADLMKRKEVSPAEVMEAAIARTEALNPKLNAIVTPLYDRAKRDDLPDGAGPLANVPFLLKDVHHALEGTPMSNGSALQQGEVSTRNATIVDRWLRAGLRVFGKTNTPEYKLTPTTNPKIFGATRNPWDLERTPGGSSGGSAAAVAARLAPLASGTDEAGSIRTPSANCGVFGLKPSRGRNPIGPDFRWELGGCSTSHVISRSVRDSAAALDATHGPELGGPYHCPIGGGFLEALQEPPSTLRVAVDTGTSYFGRPMEPSCVAAVEQAAKILERLGHHVELVPLPFDESEALWLSVILIATSFAGFVDELVDEYDLARVKRGIEPLNYFIWKAGHAVPSQITERARLQRHELARSLAEFHTRYDVLVTSTMCCAPRLIEETEPSSADIKLATVLASGLLRPLGAVPGVIERIIDAQIDSLISRVPYRTALASVTGQPAMSVPLHWTDEGLPVGVQFLGGFGSERMLLQLASQLESAHPWASKRPSHAS